MSFTPSVGIFKNLLDPSSSITGIRPIPLWVNARSLAADTAESITIPTGSNVVILAGNVDFYANCNATATVPGDTTDGTASELNPGAYCLDTNNTATTISVISHSVGIVTASFYKV